MTDLIEQDVASLEPSYIHPANKNKKLRKDYSGRRFAWLTVIGPDFRRPGNTRYFCRCRCGAVVSIFASFLPSGHTKSCGCLCVGINAERRGRHNLSGTPTYRSWQAMKARCNNHNAKGYERYGGRGITVCGRWTKGFKYFYEDMGGRPTGTSLDRINNDLGYYKENCRWANYAEQNCNQRRSVILEDFGITLNKEQWARITGIPSVSIFNALKRGITLENYIINRGVSWKVIGI